MTIYARIIASCFSASLLLGSAFAYADGPDSVPEGTPIAPPGTMSESTGTDNSAASSPEAIPVPADNYSPEAGAQAEVPPPPPPPQATASPEPAPAPKTTVQTKEVTTGTAVEIKPGETLNIDHLNFPHRGMTMAEVKKKLGEPLKADPAVGKPPITRWIYKDRTIYFEYTRVIHAVATR